MRPYVLGPRLLAVFSLLICHAAGQVTTRVFTKYKNCDATFSSGRLNIVANGRASTIELSSIPIPENECDTKCVEVSDSLRGGCYGKCAWSNPEVVAFDASQDRLILGIKTGFSQNKTIVLVEANLQDKSFRHLLAVWSAGLTHGVLSPSGRYLAYARWTHAGGCFNIASVEIVDRNGHDLQAHGSGNQDTAMLANFGVSCNGCVGDLYAAKQLSTFVPVRWQSQSVLEVQESVSGTDDCTSPIRTVQHAVDIGGLAFAAPAPIGRDQ